MLQTPKVLITTLLLCFMWLPAGANIADELPPYPKLEVNTSAGTFVMEMFSARAPLHVRNMLRLVEDKFYDNTVFHRVMGGFVVQGGGYDVDYKLKPTEKLIPNESGNGLTNKRGFVGMARTNDPHSADSQFYINLADNLALDPRPTRWGYTVIGKIIKGMEVVDEIGYKATGPGPIPELTRDVPLEPVVILSMRLLEDEAEDDSDFDDDE
ncbi:MAG: peptidyl-prolyl cis-trans isomerase [Gammaproteobacteria bacterium]|nr:peptidylprolyl isomerase [Gammaproteobacteria bacterium]NND53623.1 peptidyl-prolyl cis-trans isomerase [Gammaproteobacteria bacterium]